MKSSIRSMLFLLLSLFVISACSKEGQPGDKNKQKKVVHSAGLNAHDKDEHSGHKHESPDDAKNKPVKSEQEHSGHKPESRPAKNSHGHAGHKHKTHHEEKNKASAIKKLKHKGHGHNHGRDHHEEPDKVKLTEVQRKQIKLSIRQTSSNGSSNYRKITTTGEVKLNAYKTAEVSPRIQAQITKRLVTNGEHVKTGQPIIVMSSVEMARAQGELLLADQEWKRIKSLGTQIVSARKHTEIKIKRSVAYSKVIAYGMSKSQLELWLKNSNGANANGSFTLLSPISGTVVYDNFIEGQVVEASTKLMSISDESSIWVVAHIKPQQLKFVKLGLKAQVIRNNKNFDARVIRLPHIINEKTRTAGVILEVNNSKDTLHAGEFVNVAILTSNSKQGTSLTLPVAAVVRSTKGYWQVFVEKQRNVFFPVKVKIVKSVSGKAVITGVNVHDKIVIKGAFFLQSELAKGGFDIHNH